MGKFGASDQELEKELGENANKDEFIPHHGLNLNEDDYIQHVSITDDHSVTVDLRWLLNLKGGITNQKSDTELEVSLEKVSSYYYTFLQAYERIAQLYYDKSEEYDYIYKIKYSKTEETLIEENKEKNLSKSHLVPSQRTVDARLVKDNSQWYKEIRKELMSLERRKKFLYRIMDMINDRARHLQTILNKRRYEPGVGTIIE